MFDRAEAIDKKFVSRVQSGDLPDVSGATSLNTAGLSREAYIEMFETQVMSRQLDLIARRSKGKTFYSIGSSGHEAMAAVAKATALSDMAFLHYRDAAFLIQRRRQLDSAPVLYDMMLSFAASSDDPVSGGRHKVLGGKEIFVPPQTSTIASHLPKAVGAAHSVGLVRKLKSDTAVLPDDAVVLCSFGDASANHSTAQGAINAASWASYQNSPMPLIFICEDNDIGISVTTPSGWIQASFEHRPGLKYLSCDGTCLSDVYASTVQAVRYARDLRKPVFLHLKTVRLMGHAGADIEAAYTDIKKVEAVEEKDPLLVSATQLINDGLLSGEDIIALYRDIGARIARIADESFQRPKLESPEQIMSTIIPEIDVDVAPPEIPEGIRLDIFGKEIANHSKPQPMARHLNNALADIMAQQQNVVVFGEDVGRKGGVYSVTTGLQEKFGPARVMDTLLDEQTILGTAIGLGHNGFLPIPEIQFLAYVHNAEDQIRGEAATLPFFSNGQFTNPMVIRIAGLGYQKGFGGHFHNDNSLTVFRDIPGIILACPSSGQDAAAMLRESVRLAQEEKRVVVFVEPIALYMTADLHDEGDKLWLSPYEAPAVAGKIGFGDVGVFGDGRDVCILTYGNGYYLSRKAEKVLLEKHNLNCRVVDLRWLQPLNEKALLDEVGNCDTVLIVDECRRTGSISEQIVTLLSENGQNMPLCRVGAEDSFIPLGTAATLTLPNVQNIIDASLKLVRGAS